jgi:hypothetical protein
LPATLTAPPASRPTELCTAVHRRFPTTRQIKKKQPGGGGGKCAAAATTRPPIRSIYYYCSYGRRGPVRPSRNGPDRANRGCRRIGRNARAARRPPAPFRAVPVPPRPRRVDDHPSNRRRQKPNYLERIATLITTQELDSR